MSWEFERWKISYENFQKCDENYFVSCIPENVIGNEDSIQIFNFSITVNPDKSASSKYLWWWYWCYRVDVNILSGNPLPHETINSLPDT